MPAAETVDDRRSPGSIREAVAGRSRSWSADRVSFFPPDPALPEPDEVSRRRPWWDEPEDEMPALAPLSVVLARTERVAVMLLGARVYPDGAALLLGRRLRRTGADRRQWNELTRSFVDHFAEPDDRVKYGVEFSDGRRATTAGGMVDADAAARPETPRLSIRGGGGGGGDTFHTGHDTLWLWPLPPPGPFDLVMQWPAFGIGETHVALNADELLAAASRSRPLWPS